MEKTRETILLEFEHIKKQMERLISLVYHHIYS